MHSNTLCLRGVCQQLNQTYAWQDLGTELWKLPEKVVNFNHVVKKLITMDWLDTDYMLLEWCFHLLI
jgi:hypothetical protein